MARSGYAVNHETMYTAVVSALPGTASGPYNIGAEADAERKTEQVQAAFRFH